MKHIIVLIGPSGSGKSTIAEMLKKKYEAVEFISTTTRSPRIGEINGISYHFKTEEEFEKMLKRNEFVEHSTYAGNKYGLTKYAIFETLKKNDLCIAVLDKHGAFSIKNLFKENDNVKIHLIFVHAKISTLYLRMVERGDSVEKIAERLQNIVDNRELLQGAFCDFTIFNEDIENTKNEVRYFIEKFVKKY